MKTGLAVLASLLLGACAMLPGKKQQTIFDKEPDVRVRIAFTLDDMQATLHGPYLLVAGEKEVPLNADAVVAFTADGTNVRAAVGGESVTADLVVLEPLTPEANTTIPGVPYGVGWWWENTEDRIYEGTLYFRVNDAGHLDTVVHLPMEEYLRGVVPREIGSSSPLEALKAQAVAARSETFDALVSRKYAGPNYDICADVDCQVYGGIASRSAATDQAIRETRGLAMFHDGEPIAAYYASNCGGYSENIENVWPERSGPAEQWSGNPDYEGIGVDLTREENMIAWIEVPSPSYCNPETVPELPEWTHKHHRWEKRVTNEELAGFLAAKGHDIGAVTAIVPGQRGVSGRLIDVTFVGEKGDATITGELNIRRVFDPPLKSAAFIVSTEGPAAKPAAFVFRGAGWGHGVGMCQTGAIGRALKGQTFDTILKHYYRGVEIEPGYPLDDDDHDGDHDNEQEGEHQ
ncbi:MAG: stage sporulation protein [Candidatus Sumerlaeota bacterium]|nr:stage sporulation protein [Candidatus Sumerlaeota bacterium]